MVCRWQLTVLSLGMGEGVLYYMKPFVTWLYCQWKCCHIYIWQEGNLTLQIHHTIVHAVRCWEHTVNFGIVVVSQLANHRSVSCMQESLHHYSKKPFEGKGFAVLGAVSPFGSCETETMQKMPGLSYGVVGAKLRCTIGQQFTHKSTHSCCIVHLSLAPTI